MIVVVRLIVNPKSKKSGKDSRQERLAVWGSSCNPCLSDSEKLKSLARFLAPLLENRLASLYHYHYVRIRFRYPAKVELSGHPL